jgi:acyl-CoA dehydrogenase
MLGTNNGIVADVLIESGTVEQKQFWLPRMASGKIIASFALTEPDAGSDPSALSTAAVPDGEGWVLAGAKRYIANAPIADVLFVFARTDSNAPATQAIGTFIVPAGVSGLTIGPRYHRTGRVSAWSADGYLDEVRVPTTSLVGGAAGARSGYGTAMRCLAHGRIHIAALRVGMAERRAEGKPGGTDLSVARARVLAVARAFDHRAFDNPYELDHALSGAIPRQGPGGKEPDRAHPLP